MSVISPLHDSSISLAHAVNESLDLMPPRLGEWLAQLARETLKSAGADALMICEEEIERRLKLADARFHSGTASTNKANVVAFKKPTLTVVS